MSSLTEHLSALPPLSALPAAALTASARFWLRQELAPGERLRTQGEASDGLGVLVDGSLLATADGVELARPARGEIVGEVSAFLVDSRASATLVALEPVTLYALSSRSLLGLRRQQSPVYDALLDAALRTLSRRVRDTDAKIAALCEDRSIPPPSPPLAPPGPPPEEAPPLEPHLRGLPGLGRASDALIASLASAFTPTPMRRGDALTREGEPGAAAWVIASGEVLVSRAGGAELARLGPGDPFGFNALIDDGPRSASCVAQSDGWLWRMPRERFHRLPPPVARPWRETLLATLATQLRIANRLFAQPADHNTADFRTLLLAAGALEGLSGGETGGAEHPLAEFDPLGGVG